MTQLDKASSPPQRGLTVQMVSEMTGYPITDIALISKTVAQGAPLQELAVFLHACRELRLDPLLRQAYWIRRKDKGTLQVGIDGFRAIADRSGAYAGSEPPLFRGSVSLPNDIDVPEKASVVVWKIVQGHRAAFTGEAYWREFYPGPDAAGAMWRKMPHHMLGKCAEGQALRKAFPALLGGVEMSDSDGISSSIGMEVTELPTVNPPSPSPPKPQERPRTGPSVTAADYARTVGQFYDEVADEPPAQSPEPVAEENQAGFVDDPYEQEQAEREQALVVTRDLIAEAGRLKIKTPSVPRSATLAQLIACNAELQRLINRELDRQAGSDTAA